MEELVYDLKNYLINGDLSTFKTETVFNCEKSCLIVLVKWLLSWLKLEYKRFKWKENGRPIDFKPLELNMKFDWCRLLVKLVEEDERLSKIFMITTGKRTLKYLNFRDTVSEEDRMVIRYQAFKLYNPQPITKRG